MNGTKILCKNPSAYLNYTFLKKYTAGICLQGWEVKSLRRKHATVGKQCYASLGEQGLMLKNMNIAIYGGDKFPNRAAPLRDRVLLLRKKELAQIKAMLQNNPLLTIAVCNVVLQASYIKVVIAVAKGIKKYEKRRKLQEKEWKKKDAFWQ